LWPGNLTDIKAVVNVPILYNSHAIALTFFPSLLAIGFLLELIHAYLRHCCW
jgi:hypothetical protein